MKLLPLLVFAATACSRTQPYYRYDVAPMCAPAPAEVVDARLLLIGDAGDADPDGEPVLHLLRQKALELPDRTTVVFLGDNVYERGMVEKTVAEPLAKAAEAAEVVLPDIVDPRKDAERRLNAQIDVVRGTDIPAVFIPGNHDWDQLERGGWERILEQDAFIDDARAAGADVWLLPEGGCPGPVSVPLGRRGALIVLDTQWWLETPADGKPTAAHNPTGCYHVTEDAVVEGLVEELRIARRDGRNAVVAGHHPLESLGPHGGFFDWRTHLFPMRSVRHYVPIYLEWLPLPGLGTATVLARSNFSPSPQDFSHRRNERLRARLRAAMERAEKEGAPALVYAAGHDHSLQVFRTAPGPYYAVVSGFGAGSRGSAVGANNHTLFAHANDQRPGFMVLDFLSDGAVRLSVIEVVDARIAAAVDGSGAGDAGDGSVRDDSDRNLAGIGAGGGSVAGEEVFSIVLTTGRSPEVSRWQRLRHQFWGGEREERGR